MNSNNRIAVTLYSLGTYFVSGIPCIKEMMMMLIVIIRSKSYLSMPLRHVWVGKP